MNPLAWKPAEANYVTTYLTVADGARALAFYERAFGFTPGNVMREDDGRVGHAEMHYQGAIVIMFAPEGAWGSTDRTPAHMGLSLPLNFYVYCPDVDARTDEAKRAGAKVLAAPQDMFWGDRMAKLEDPDGYVWCFATRTGEFDPAKMPR